MQLIPNPIQVHIFLFSGHELHNLERPCGDLICLTDWKVFAKQEKRAVSWVFLSLTGRLKKSRPKVITFESL